jgi:hypothetical protein
MLIAPSLEQIVRNRTHVHVVGFGNGGKIAARAQPVPKTSQSFAHRYLVVRLVSKAVLIDFKRLNHLPLTLQIES